MPEVEAPTWEDRMAAKAAARRELAEVARRAAAAEEEAQWHRDHDAEVDAEVERIADDMTYDEAADPVPFACACTGSRFSQFGPCSCALSAMARERRLARG